MAKRHMIVPLFIPHQGCPYRCVFCDQNEISGEDRAADKKRLESVLHTYLTPQNGRSLPSFREAAFYGGTFTGLPTSRQEFLLSVLQPLMDSGSIHAIRVSTHARFIDSERLDRLWRSGVRTVELGVQSMDPQVSLAAGRVGAEAEVPPASRLIRDRGFRLGLQLMPGLPGDTEDSFLQTVDQVIGLQPDFVRIYPTLVVRNTELHKLYLQGLYQPWELERILMLLQRVAKIFRNAAIPIIRMGLHPEPSLLENLVAGPFHPSLKYLVDCRLALEEMESIVEGNGWQGKAVVFQVPFRRISHYTGPLKQNIETLRSRYNLKSVLLRPSHELSTAVGRVANAKLSTPIG